MKTLLNLAEALAKHYHRNQKYASHLPYSFHLEQVVYNCMGYGLDEEHRIVAWLHDILEDTDIEPELIYSLFDVTIYNAVIALTKKPNGVESNNEYIERVSKNKLALRVKLCDTEANLNYSLGKQDARRICKYQLQLEKLLEKLDEN